MFEPAKIAHLFCRVAVDSEHEKTRNEGGREMRVSDDLSEDEIKLQQRHSGGTRQPGLLRPVVCSGGN